MLRTHRSEGPADMPVPAHLSNSATYSAPSPEEYALAGREPPHVASLTEVAADSLRSGIVPDEPLDQIPGEDANLRAGDPDVSPLDNEYNGDEMPGSANPTPDQNDVDAIGRAYGLSELQDGTMRSPDEILDKRDARPWDAERKERES